MSERVLSPRAFIESLLPHWLYEPLLRMTTSTRPFPRPSVLHGISRVFSMPTSKRSPLPEPYDACLVCGAWPAEKTNDGRSIHAAWGREAERLSRQQLDHLTDDDLLTLGADTDFEILEVRQ